MWDPKKKKTITAKKQQSVIDYNVFEGFEVTGLPRFTLSRGDVVFEDGKVKAEHGRGQFVERPPHRRSPVAVVVEGADHPAAGAARPEEYASGRLGSEFPSLAGRG